MKITDPEVIRSGEKDLIDAVKKDLDLDAVKDIIKNRLTAKALSSRGGQIVVHDNQVAFQLDFDVQLSGSLLFDREGNHIRTPEDPEPEQEAEPAESPETEASEDTDESLDSVELEDSGEETEILPESGDMAAPEPDEDMDDEEEMHIDLPDYGVEDEDVETDESPSPEEGGEPETLAGEEENDLENLDLEDEALLQEEVIDEDINGILQESRDFWEQKKDS